MVGRRVPGAPARADRRRHGKKKKAPAGLRVIDRDGYWHLSGTVRVKGRSSRIREGTGLPATPENWDAADAIRRQREGEIVDQVVHGIKPTAPVSIAADLYLSQPRERPLSPTDVRQIKKIAGKFEIRSLRSIDEGEWVSFVDDDQRGNAPSSRERFLNTVVAFLNWCKAKPREYIAEIPSFERNNEVRSPVKRMRRRVAELTPDLIILMLEHAHIANQAQYVVEWSTGGRVSSVLHETRLCDLSLAPGREQLTFGETKNGDPVFAALHPYAVEVLKEYLAFRGRLHDREGPLFLDYRGRAYRQRYGGNRTAFNAMRWRTAKTIRRRAAAARAAGDMENAAAFWATAALICKVTQHWFRHWFATHAMASSMDPRSAMEQAGWRDHRSFFGYAHDVPEIRRKAVASLPIGGPAPLGRAEMRKGGRRRRTG